MFVQPRLKGSLKDSTLYHSEKFKADKNIISFSSKLKANIEEVVKQLPKEENKLREELRKVELYTQSKEYDLKRIPRIIGRIEVLSNQLEQKIEEPQNKVDELIKRLLLSIVVVSFILTLLRFVAMQYKSNYLEMIKAEKEDLYMRKLYVGLKNARENQEINKLVMSSLLNNQKEAKDESNLTNDEVGILKNTIETILNKLNG